LDKEVKEIQISLRENNQVWRGISTGTANRGNKTVIGLEWPMVKNNPALTIA